MRVQISVKNRKEEVQGNHASVVCMYKAESLVREDHAFAGMLQSLKDADKFKGDDGQVYHVTTVIDQQLQDVIFVGLGEREKLTREKLRKSIGKAVKKVKEQKGRHIDLDLRELAEDHIDDIISAAVEGALLADYEFSKYKSNQRQAKLDSINIVLEQEDYGRYEPLIEEGRILAEGIILARNLTNEPANVLGPIELAEKAKDIAAENGLEVQVFTEDKIRELGMDSFMAVAQGSQNPPRFIVLKYQGNPSDSENVLGLVGKGLTYDSGGYSIKPNEAMLNMKSDMAGAAAVLGAMTAITKMKVLVNVTAIIAACENMVSGNAYKPGDIIGSMAGKTIEVQNTDAEGRLTLADAVYYAVNVEKVSKVVDIATLTAAILIALGKTTTGVITNNQEFFQTLQQASVLSGEKVWQLPNDEEYKSLIKSEVADLKNVGGKHSGAITAGLFIGEFAGDCPWLHMDIAGTSWTDSNEGCFCKGATGVGVRTLYYLAKSIAVQ